MPTRVDYEKFIKQHEKREKYYGFYRSLVVNDKDPEYCGQIQIWIPDLQPEDYKHELDKCLWAFPANNHFGGRNDGTDKHGSRDEDVDEIKLYAYGASWIPRINSWVWLFFENGNPNRPFYMNSVDLRRTKVPVEGQWGENYHRKWYNRSPKGHVMILSDDQEVPVSDATARILPAEILEEDTRTEMTGHKKHLEEIYKIVDNQSTVLIDDRKDRQKILIQDWKGNHIIISTHQNRAAIYINEDLVIRNHSDQFSLICENGRMNIYAKNGISMRSDAQIHIKAKQNIEVRTEQDIRMEAKWSIFANAKINMYTSGDLMNYVRGGMMTVVSGKIAAHMKSTVATNIQSKVKIDLHAVMIRSLGTAINHMKSNVYTNVHSDVLQVLKSKVITMRYSGVITMDKATISMDKATVMMRGSSIDIAMSTAFLKTASAIMASASVIIPAGTMLRLGAGFGYLPIPIVGGGGGGGSFDVPEPPDAMDAEKANMAKKAVDAKPWQHLPQWMPNLCDRVRNFPLFGMKLIEFIPIQKRCKHPASTKVKWINEQRIHRPLDLGPNFPHWMHFISQGPLSTETVKKSNQYVIDFMGAPQELMDFADDISKFWGGETDTCESNVTPTPMLPHDPMDEKLELPEYLGVYGCS